MKKARFGESGGRTLFVCLLGLATLLVGACAQPSVQPQSAERRVPRLLMTSAMMEDGYRLPLRRWGNAENARAVVLALHGFNDYSNAFAGLGPALAEQRILTYAYDQRGFGNSSGRGLWPGTERLITDLRTLLRLLRQDHAGLPLVVAGESMGGAVIIAAATVTYQADGTILIAPAVWSRKQMPFYQRAALRITAYTLPWLRLTGEGIDIRPSDNIEMLRALGADPLVIKATRADALWGIGNLMDRATNAFSSIRGPLLLLYGEHDEIIPRSTFCHLLDALPDKDPEIQPALYRNGWHLLTRDLQGNRVIADIAAWIHEPATPLPSREGTQPGSKRLQRFCRDDDLDQRR